MADGEVQVKEEGKFKSGLRSCCTFLYNRDDGTIMGRGCGSWAKIGTFYFFFYSFLAGFFAMNMYVLLTTIDPERPTITGRSNKPQVAIEQGASRFMNLGEKEGFDSYVAAVKEIRDQYDNYTATKAEGAEVFRWTHVAEYDNAMYPGCSDPDKYSFEEGRGCFFLGLNRMYGFDPTGNNTDARFFFDCKFDQGITGKGDTSGTYVSFNVVPDPKNPDTDYSKFYPWFSIEQNGMQPLVMVNVTVDVAALKATNDRPDSAFITCLPYTQTGSEERVQLEDSRFARVEIIYPWKNEDN